MFKTDAVRIKVGKILKELLQEREISIHKIVIFGSYARRAQKQNSDIDL